MKILLFKWKVYMNEDIQEALENLGHKVDIFERRPVNYNEDPEFTQELVQVISEGSYDLVFSVNYFGAVSEGCMNCGIKYVVWTCDSPLISMHHESVFNDCNYIFIFDKVNYHIFKNMGHSRVYYLPLAVNVSRIDRVLAESKDIRNGSLDGISDCSSVSGSDSKCINGYTSEFLSDITFVGSMYEKNSYDEIKDNMSDYLQGYFDALMLAQIDIFGENIADRLLTPEILYELSEIIELKQDERSFSNLALVFSTTFLGFKIASLERKICLAKLAEHHMVKLYSDQHGLVIPGVINEGSVDYHKDMPKVFNRSRINLNFTIRNIRSGIPLRVWDVLGAGGFMLTNFQAEIPMYFENGKDLVFFESTDDLVRKADYYLEHEEQRCAIARNGYEKVKKYHSYETRLKQILETIKD